MREDPLGDSMQWYHIPFDRNSALVPVASIVQDRAGPVWESSCRDNEDKVRPSDDRIYQTMLKLSCGLAQRRIDPRPVQMLERWNEE